MLPVGGGERERQRHNLWTANDNGYCYECYTNEALCRGGKAVKKTLFRSYCMLVRFQPQTNVRLHHVKILAGAKWADGLWPRNKIELLNLTVLYLRNFSCLSSRIRCLVQRSRPDLKVNMS